MMLPHLLALSLAFLLDRLIGDPPSWPHPVKWMGAYIARLDRLLNHGHAKKRKGLLMMTSLLLIVFALTSVIVYLAYQQHVAAGILVEAVLISTTLAQKSLHIAGMDVYRPLALADLTEARSKLSYIVGRDTDQLHEGEIVRATVETIAENTSDGITAPLFWAFIGGAPLAMMYRAINTCDSMVGYRNKQYLDFGWASAKMDDVVNWIPARLTGMLMLLNQNMGPHSFRKRAAIVVRDAKVHPSPNSGWGEAAVAALLGVQLGGVNYYKGVISNRAKMGESVVPLQANHIKLTTQIMHRTSWLFILMLWIGGILLATAASWI